ncbi:hypothetical protein [Chroococcidiopsis sp. SAG 2025]|uniref:hypothetical protein n=1 Tax=Chroococcidiopsis sp. SAG 2025 TaxID=171389 RepID=UPI002936E829|nr:hypothetical protein [Chroococcidiopsis sp. SAG 2025]
MTSIRRFALLGSYTVTPSSPTDAVMNWSFQVRDCYVANHRLRQWFEVASGSLGNEVAKQG